MRYGVGLEHHLLHNHFYSILEKKWSRDEDALITVQQLKRPTISTQIQTNIKNVPKTHQNKTNFNIIGMDQMLD